MKKSKIISLVLFTIGLSGLVYYFSNHSIKTLDCDLTYYQAYFHYKFNSGEIEKEKVKGYEEFNAREQKARCLCEKYLNDKNDIYKKEILKIYNDLPKSWKEYDNTNGDIDSICKHKEDVFLFDYNFP